MNIKNKTKNLSCLTYIILSPILIPFWILLFSFNLFKLLLLKIFVPKPLYRLQPIIEELSGKDFEKYLEELFEKMGYKIKYISPGNDQGADLVINKNKQDIVVQAKRHSYKVTNKAVQEAVAAIGYYKCQGAMVVTNSVFTDAAKELAEANGIDLIDGIELNRLIKKYLDH